MEVDTWRKAKRSEGGANNCVEIQSGLAAVRDSKNPDMTLLVNAAALVAAARHDWLSR